MSVQQAGQMGTRYPKPKRDFSHGHSLEEELTQHFTGVCRIMHSIQWLPPCSHKNSDYFRLPLE